MARQSNVDFKSLELLVLDVDGVLTDGDLVLDGDGRETKVFSILDGHGIRMWRRAGLQVAIISGRQSPPTRHRAAQMEVEHVLEDCHYKLPALQKLLEQIKLSPDRVVYVGDDLPDLPIIRYVGFGVAVANAVDEVKQEADYTTARAGGSGAVREVIEYVLKRAGRWDELMKRYLS